MALRLLAREAVKRLAGGLPFERSPLRELARLRDAVREVEADERVAEFAGAAGRPSVDAPAQHHAATDAGADRQDHEVSGDELQRFVMRLGKRGDGGIVVDEHRHPQSLSKYLPKGHVGERDVGRGHDFAGGELDDRRNPDPDAVERAVAAHLAYE